MKAKGWKKVLRTMLVFVLIFTFMATPVLASTTRLSAYDARKMVTDKFGGIVQKIEYAYDDTNPHYKGEALKKGYKVVFEINARTQKITKWDVGNSNDWDEFARALPRLKTMNQAAAAVIARTGKTNTFVQKIEFKYDKSEPLYVGEVFNKNVKYVFEYRADTGRFQKFSASWGDETWAEQYYNVR